MARFTDIPFYLIKKYYDSLPVSASEEATEASFSSEGQAPIITTTHESVEFVLKVKLGTDESFYSGGGIPVELEEGESTGNFKYVYFNFDIKGYDDDKIIIEYLPNDLTNTVNASGWDISTEFEEDTEIYIRKGTNQEQEPEKALYWFAVNSKTQDELDDDETDTQKDSNTVFFQKDYYFIGKAFSTNVENQYNVFIENINKFAVKALPVFNRTEKLKEFLKLAFEHCYQDIYCKQKNLFSIIDPYETNYSTNNYLYYIANAFNVDIDKNFFASNSDNNDAASNINDIDKRTFVKYLPSFLKRKGTYTSIFATNQFNQLNTIKVYERWHPVWNWGSLSEYTTFKENSDVPYPIKLSDTLKTKFDPETRFVDFDYLNYYSKSLSGCCYDDREINDSGMTRGGVTTVSAETSFIHVQELESKTWIVTHNLNTENVSWQCFKREVNIDESLNGTILKIVPEIAEWKDANTIVFTFEFPIKGYVFGTTSDNLTGTIPTPVDLYNWQFTHNFHSMFNSTNILHDLYPITSYFDDSGVSMTISASNEVPVNGDTLKFYFPTDTYALSGLAEHGDYIHQQIVPSNKWTINHNLETDVLGVVTKFYITVPVTGFDLFHNLDSADLIVQAWNADSDGSLNLITPLTISIIDDNCVHIEFDDLFEGVVVLSKSNYTMSDETAAILLPPLLWVYGITVTHNLNSEYNIIQSFNASGSDWSPEKNCVTFNNNQFFSYFPQFGTQYIRTKEPDYIEHIHVSNKTWTIEHNLASDNNLDYCYPMVQIYLPTDNISSAYWYIYHGLNTQNLFVQAFNSDNELIIPTNIDTSDLNFIVVEFNQAEIGYCHVAPVSGDDFSTSYSELADTVKEVTHSPWFNYQVEQLYNGSFEWFQPFIVETNGAKIKVFFADAASGKINVSPADWLFEANEFSDIWYVSHFNTTPGIYQFFTPTLTGDTWEMTHNLGENVMTFLYDQDNCSIPFEYCNITNGAVGNHWQLSCDISSSPSLSASDKPSGYAVVCKVDNVDCFKRSAHAGIWGNDHNWMMLHDISSENTIVQCFDESDPIKMWRFGSDIDSIQIIDGNNIEVKFNSEIDAADVVSGYILFKKFEEGSDYLRSETVTAGGYYDALPITGTYEIEHELNTDGGIMYACYDKDGYLFEPDVFEITTSGVISVSIPEDSQYVGGVARLIIISEPVLLREKIPNKLTILDDDRLKAEWEYPMKGYMSFKDATQIKQLATVSPSAAEELMEIKHIDHNTIEVTFDDAYYGVAALAIPDFTGIYVEGYNDNEIDDAGYYIKRPESLTLEKGYITAKFKDGEEKSGYCIVKGIGSIGYHGGLIMSPHYRVELNLSCQPYTTEEILPKSMASLLYNSWEYVRPVCKFAHYDLLVQPIVDLTAEVAKNLYENSVGYPYLNSINVAPIWRNPSNAPIYMHRQITDSYEWIVEHNLESDVLVQCFNVNKRQIWPAEIQKIDSNTVVIKFNKLDSGDITPEKQDLKGFVLVIAAEEVYTDQQIYIPTTYEWEILQSLEKKSMSELYDYQDYIVFPDEIQNIGTEGSALQIKVDFAHKSKGTLVYTQREKEIFEVKTIPVSGDSVLSSTFLFSNQKYVTLDFSKWIPPDVRPFEGVFVQVFDSNGFQIQPDEIILNMGSCIILFNTDVTGYALLKAIGQIYTKESIFAALEDATIQLGNGNVDFSGTNVQQVKQLTSPILFNDTPVIASNLSFINEKAADGYYHLKGTTTSDFEGKVTEIGVFEGENMLFYSWFPGGIYKLADMDFSVEYKIDETYIIPELEEVFNFLLTEDEIPLACETIDEYGTPIRLLYK